MELTCHCGNIRLTASKAPAELASCNCSICRRYAALWAYYPPSEVQVESRDQPPVSYIWGDKEVAFEHCGVCGCITHYRTLPNCDSEILAINMRMAESELVQSLPRRSIDGAGY